MCAVMDKNLKTDIFLKKICSRVWVKFTVSSSEALLVSYIIVQVELPNNFVPQQIGQ